MSILDQIAAGLKGRYRVERELGAGGMATVFLARDLKHDRPVAIKVLRPELAQRIGAERFLEEIRTTANLQHPHILPLFDSGDADGLVFFVMPYVAGETLRGRLAHGERFELSEVLRLATEIAGALDYAHKRGIVHRDVKPENILLHEGRPLVADFGIARADRSLDETRITGAGAVIGTPGYMSPEQARGDPDIDGRSDQYSLASVVAEMVSSRRGRTTPPPGGAAEPRPQVPAGLEQAIRRAMALDPDDRFPSIAAFATALQAGASEASGAKQSIAVLPFENMSAEAGNDYFADGMAEDIINALAQLPDLRVVARASAFSFKGRTADLQEIGEKLHVRYVLEGSVRRAGDRLRITAQLVSVHDGFQLWSERYDRRMDDVFAIQDEIATTIAAKLQVTLAGGDGASLVKPKTANLEAYDAYLKGTAAMRRRGSGLLEAIACFREAIALDPNYAPALAGLTDALILSSFWGINRPRDTGPEAVSASARALAADPTLVEAHVAAALVALEVEFDRGKSAEAFRHAVALAPGDAEARATRSIYDYGYIHGDFAGAEREARAVLDADPLNPMRHSVLGLVLTFAGRNAEAAAEARRAIALDPDALYGPWILVLSLLGSRAYDDAIDAATAIMQKFGRHSWLMMGAASAYAALSRMEEATALYDELRARARTEYVQPAILALVASFLGRNDEALKLWNQAADERDMMMPSLLCFSPLSAAIRALPEHQALLARLGWDQPIR